MSDADNDDVYRGVELKEPYTFVTIGDGIAVYDSEGGYIIDGFDGKIDLADFFYALGIDYDELERKTPLKVGWPTKLSALRLKNKVQYD